MKLAEAQINADRTSNLALQLTAAPYPSETELLIIFEGKNAKTQKLNVFRVPTEGANHGNIPEFNWKTLTLKMPAASLEKIDGSPTKIYLKITTKLGYYTKVNQFVRKM